MTRNEIINGYFRWLSGFVNEQRPSSRISYNKLLNRLHDIEFIYLHPMDENRASNGVSLRYRYACECDDFEAAKAYLVGPCSVLEMMIALSLKCEGIMDDPNMGDRTGQWFWEMIVSLGLGSMYDSKFDREYVDEVIERFINRDYEPNGKGGLFTIRNCARDLRDVEIWWQLMWYINSTP